MDRRVSFVITARNEDPTVVNATVDGILATLRGQCHEIVIVDDGGDQPVDVHAAAVRIIRNPEPVGVTRARHIGTKAATGDVLVWLDAHMTFELGWLDVMLREVDSGALLCAPWQDYERCRVHYWCSDFGWCEERAYERGLRPGFDFSHRLKRPRASCARVPMIIGACYMMRRDAYARMGGFCPLFRTYGGDEPDLSARVWLSGGTVRCVRAARVGHLDRRAFPYPVSFDDVEFNQLVMIRSLFEERAAAVLEDFFQPLPEKVAAWLTQTDIEGWRAEVQGRRKMSDAEFFQRIAPRVPVSFGVKVRVRRGHFSLSRIRSALALEEGACKRTEVLCRTGQVEDAGVVIPQDCRLIQAGVVTWQGRAIILPGGTDTGRRALVFELVRAGAVFCSDSYAVLDPDGFVHPAVRVAGSDEQQPLPLGVVATIQFYPGRRWQLRQVSPADAALDLLAHAISVRDPRWFCRASPLPASGI